MIQTKTPIVYGDRSERTGIIRVEVRPLTTTVDGCKLLVVDWDTTSESLDPIFSKEVFYSNEKIDQIDAYLESTNDFSAMTKSEKESRKLQLALMLDTQTNLLPSGKTIYRLTPNDWELTLIV
jgi:hypothetical protein